MISVLIAYPPLRLYFLLHRVTVSRMLKRHSVDGAAVPLKRGPSTLGSRISSRRFVLNRHIPHGLFSVTQSDGLDRALALALFPFSSSLAEGGPVFVSFHM